MLLLLVGCVSAPPASSNSVTEPITTLPEWPDTPAPTTPLPTTSSSSGHGSETSPGTYDLPAWVLSGALFAVSDVVPESGVPLVAAADETWCGLLVGPAGDVDGDGVGDVAFGCIETASDLFRVHLISGGGVLAGVVAPFATVTSPVEDPAWADGSTGLGDIDGDGLGEVAFGSVDPASSGWVFGGAELVGDVGPDAVRWIVDGVGYGSERSLVAAGDQDADGLLDLWVPDRTYVPTVSRVSLVTASTLQATPAGGVVDVQATTNAVLEGQPDGWTFDRTVFPVGDLTGDGSPDLAVLLHQLFGGGPDVVGEKGELRVFTSFDASIVAPAVILQSTLADQSEAAAAGDLDRDGLGELYVMFLDGDEAQIALVSGATVGLGGTLLLGVDTPMTEITGVRPMTVACDVDGDQVPELFVGADNEISVFHAADVAVGGAVSFATLAWGGDVWCLGDLDGDGIEELGLGYAQ